MTDRYWNESSDAARMLDYVLGRRDHRDGGRMVSDRRLRLFACACCRAVWNLLADERSRRAVEVAELFADGRTLDLAEGQRAGNVAYRRSNPVTFLPWAACARDIIRQCFGPNWFESCQAAGLSPATQATLLREIIGNPFQPIIINEGQCTLTTTRGIVLDRRWLTTTVVSLATAAYSERHDDGTLDNDRLGVLADCLEDEGCNSTELLAHLRSIGPHVRGCWVLDVLLGKV